MDKSVNFSPGANKGSRDGEDTINQFEMLESRTDQETS